MRDTEGVMLVVVPGGPGLSPGYLRPWLLEAAKSLDAEFLAVDYSDFAEPSSAPPRRRLLRVLRKVSGLVRKLSARRRVVLVGHSFGARIVLEMLRRSPSSVAAAVLVNCPAEFAPSREFELGKRRLRLPARVESEDDFRRYWKAVLPLYFYARPKRGWIAVLVRRTRWAETAWLGSAVTGEPEGCARSGMPPMLFINGGRDRRFPASNAARLRRIFPSARHSVIAGASHFPMLENPGTLTAELLAFLSR